MKWSMQNVSQEVSRVKTCMTVNKKIIGWIKKDRLAKVVLAFNADGKQIGSFKTEAEAKKKIEPVKKEEKKER